MIRNVYSKEDINKQGKLLINLRKTKIKKSLILMLRQKLLVKFIYNKEYGIYLENLRIFSDLISNDTIFDLMSFFLGTEFTCGSYCASRLMPGAPGQELHIDYPYWDYYKSETFPIGLNSSFPKLSSYYTS